MTRAVPKGLKGKLHFRQVCCGRPRPGGVHFSAKPTDVNPAEFDFYCARNRGQIAKTLEKRLGKGQLFSATFVQLRRDRGTHLNSAGLNSAGIAHGRPHAAIHLDPNANYWSDFHEFYRGTFTENIQNHIANPAVGSTSSEPHERLTQVNCNYRHRCSNGWLLRDPGEANWRLARAPF